MTITVSVIIILYDSIAITTAQTLDPAASISISIYFILIID